MEQEFFIDLDDVYEAMVNWPRRLAHEEPFYRQLFSDLKAQSVLDVACGPGRHAAMFHSWGMRVEGSDLSARMIERAAATFTPDDRLKWTIRSFDQPVDSLKAFDVAICVGNSLALAPDMPTAQQAVEQMLAAVRTGGAVVVQLMNLWRLPDGPCVWQKCVRANLERGEALIIKGVHRSNGRGFVDLIVAALQQPPAMQSTSSGLLSLREGDIKTMFHNAGAADVAIHGGWHGEAYDENTSADLIAVALKR